MPEPSPELMPKQTLVPTPETSPEPTPEPMPEPSPEPTPDHIPGPTPDLSGGGTWEVITYDNFESRYGNFNVTDDGISSGDASKMTMRSPRHKTRAVAFSPKENGPFASVTKMVDMILLYFTRIHMM
jgi:outer membrane biosynthesis protein TonB